MDQPVPALSLAEIAETRAMIAPHVIRTPVHDWQGGEIGALLAPGTRVNLKLELFQRSGTFKARGAVVEGVAAQPRGACPRHHRGQRRQPCHRRRLCRGTLARAQGGDDGLGQPGPGRRLSRARRRGGDGAGRPHRLRDGRGDFPRRGRSFIHPFEGPFTALGTATLGMEWLEQVPDLEAVIIAIGGGGLCGGASAAIKLLKPDCLVFGVEPTGSDTMTRSFAQGSRSTMPR
jgi:threonine dehydratase